MSQRPRLVPARFVLRAAFGRRRKALATAEGQVRLTPTLAIVVPETVRLRRHRRSVSSMCLYGLTRVGSAYKPGRFRRLDRPVTESSTSIWSMTAWWMLPLKEGK